MTTYVLLVLRVTVCVTVATAGLAKLVTPELPAAFIRDQLPWLRHDQEVVVARVFGGLEFLASAATVIAPTRRAGAVCGVMLGCIIVAASARAVWVNSRVPCGCFGAYQLGVIGSRHIALGLIITAAFALSSIDRFQAQGNTPRQAALLAFSIGLIILQLYHSRTAVVRMIRVLRGPNS